MIGRMNRRLLTIVAALAVSATSVAGQDLEAFWSSEMRGLRQALESPSTNSRVRNIWFQLARDTGEAYPVFPAQQFNLGQALPNGVVLLDLSIAGNTHVEVTAFTLAHEYGHQTLGHTRMILTPVGQWLAAVSGTMQEDAADRFAGRFLRRNDYNLAPVLEFLCNLPGGGPGDTHSAGPARARNVAIAAGASGADVCEASVEDLPTFQPSLRIWSNRAGNPTEMEIEIDGEYVGSLSNLDEAETIDLGELTEGQHTFTLKDIVTYGLNGWGNLAVIASGLECSGTFRVRSDRTYRLWARLYPNGEVQCRFE